MTTDEDLANSLVCPLSGSFKNAAESVAQYDGPKRQFLFLSEPPPSNPEPIIATALAETRTPILPKRDFKKAVVKATEFTLPPPLGVFRRGQPRFDLSEIYLKQLFDWFKEKMGFYPLVIKRKELPVWAVDYDRKWYVADENWGAINVALHRGNRNTDIEYLSLLHFRIAHYGPDNPIPPEMMKKYGIQNNYTALPKHLLK